MTKPIVYMTPLAYAKLFGYARKCPIEISGMGFVDVLPGKGFLVKDVFLVKQKGSSGGTELDQEALGKMASEWIMNGEEWKNEKMKTWFHSHGKLSCFWSGTDTEQMNKNFSHTQWMLSIVVNQKGEYKARLDIHYPIHIEIDDLQLVLEADIPAELDAQLTQDIKDNLEFAPVYTPPKYQKPYTPKKGHWDSLLKEYIIDEENTTQLEDQSTAMLLLAEQV